MKEQQTKGTATRGIRSKLTLTGALYAKVKLIFSARVRSENTFYYRLFAQLLELLIQVGRLSQLFVRAEATALIAPTVTIVANTSFLTIERVKIEEHIFAVEG